MESLKTTVQGVWIGLHRRPTVPLNCYASSANSKSLSLLRNQSCTLYIGLPAPSLPSPREKRLGEVAVLGDLGSGATTASFGLVDAIDN